ncbi:hypothetical protein HBI56_126850 [Parastagonospora nodorum]|uniref:Uncharacterized protein n=1 Tax=Phaeosphaeria nodorum (strain SN15 / ATCC MYA-4574 / FGSC 10173) TaxID=321614 RepID=A0A7U2I448_PHANO|nr:hypothetical protein HBH56_168210 [Parastagonospora nodorum]QRC98682.1 hypothetical protein JI435_412440 [Parastagonospora nodorum SN15]KAH3936631.1 hypothetical protein HBH54_031300 [Parastagonospora nodorum]KAH3948380.1 hypothetical protein HBH53_106070 [Parastagonospora nodorum]KAH3968685.1 hypothetical protein HBH51_129990 [Parastagonospora nodorum]
MDTVSRSTVSLVLCRAGHPPTISCCHSRHACLDVSGSCLVGSPMRQAFPPFCMRGFLGQFGLKESNEA